MTNTRFVVVQVRVKVAIPRKVQGEERRLVEELKELSTKKPARGIFG